MVLLSMLKVSVAQVHKNKSSTDPWEELLAYTEEKIRRILPKTLRLEALLASLRQQWGRRHTVADAGAEFRQNLSMLLH